MTGHIFITCFILIIFLIIQKRDQNNRVEIPFQLSLNLFVVFALIPFSYPSMTPIADYLFVGFSDNLIWFSILFIPVWLYTSYLVYKTLRLAEASRIKKIWSVFMSLVLLVAYFCALFTSHYESGPTPTVTSSNYLISYFIGIHVTIVMTLLVQLFFLIKTNKVSGIKWGISVATFFTIFLYLIMIYNF